MDTVMPLGNSAKMYCLKKLVELAATGRPLVVLDMGCGSARNFLQFVDSYPNVRYVGTDPYAPSLAEARRNFTGKNAEFHDAGGESFSLAGGADAIVSFSVFEHVKIGRRRAYLEAVRRNLKPDGRAFINYDAGHFTTESTTQQHVTAARAMRQALGQFGRNFMVERFGMPLYYQRFVTESSFLEGCAAAGLRVLESKSFNTGLKQTFRLVKPEAREEFMRRWLDLELWLNSNSREYDDDQAATFTTRCHMLAPGDLP